MATGCAAPIRSGGAHPGPALITRPAGNQPAGRVRRSGMRRFTVMCAAAAAAAVLTGCGAQTGDQPGGGAPPTSKPVPSASTTPSGAPTVTEPAGTPSGPTLELDGTAAPGVEPGCVVFSTGGRRYLLVGAKGTVPTEVPIRVRGVVLTGVLSYCQQGTPLKVLEITRR